MAIANSQLLFLEYGQDSTVTITLSTAEDVSDWTVAFTVYAYNGGPVIFTKTIGSGVTVSNATTGVFEIAISATNTSIAPGSYHWSFKRTNANFAYPICDDSSLIIKPSSASPYPTLVTLAEVSSLLNLPTLTDDQVQTYLGLIYSAEAAVRKYCGRQFTYGSYVEYIDGNHTNVIQLREPPVTSITSVYVDPPSYAGQSADPFPSTTLLTAGEDYYLDKSRSIDGTSLNGHLIRIGTAWPTYRRREQGRLSSRIVGAGGAIKVTYIGGYALVPFDLKMAIAQIVAQRAIAIPQGGFIVSQSGEGRSESLAAPDVENKMIGSVKSVLNSYRSPSCMIG